MKDEEEEETNRWFSRWEEGLPSAEELTPLSQTLITPDLALAFDITTNYSSPSTRPNHHLHHHHHPSKPSNSPSQSHNPPNSQTHQDPFDSSDVAAGAAGGVAVDDQARTLKRPRLVWTPQLHKRFVDAVAHLGIKNAVPKTIMQLMSVDGLTRENVASHLQKYRLYLKRMQQGMTSPPAGGCPPTSASIAAAGPLLHDPATEQLFATGPLPHHLLQHHHHHHMAAALHHQHLYHHHHHQRSVSHVSSPPFDHLSYASPRQLSLQQRVVGGGQPTPLTSSFGQEYEQARSAVGAERKVLTLFPTND